MRIDLRGLNTQQRLAVETTEGPVLVLAGAGTGKTRVITTRIARLIALGIPPENILGVTFTNKAAREMLERVRALLNGRDGRRPRGRPRLSTFHSWAARTLREFAPLLGYTPDFVIYDEADQIGVLRGLLARNASRGAGPDPRATAAALSLLRNGTAPERLRGDAAAAEAAVKIRKAYEQTLKARNAMDFDDLLLRTLQLFREHPQALQSCRRRHRYVMVDEYQDTNPIQFELVRLLCEEHRNICVVGDDDQSIYGWRGAETANILQFERSFPEAKVIKLEQNYRSTNTILRAANALIRHNAARREKALWSSRGDGPPIRLRAFPNEEEEAKAAVAAIKSARFPKKIPFSHFAILYRTNTQSRPLEAALRRAGIRYHVVGGQSFFDRREARDFLAYMRIAVNPRDDNALLRVANTPARGLSEKTMQRLLAAAHARGISVWEAMRSEAVRTEFPARARNAMKGFVEMLEQARAELEAVRLNAEGKGLAEWARNWLERIGYPAELRRLEKNPEAGENRARNLLDLAEELDRAETESRKPAARLAEALSELALDAERKEEKEPAPDAVTLITIHSCKGLEFPHVLIVGLEEGLLPHARSEAEGALEEERRLFYVAVTRAMRSLRLSYCESRRKHGRRVPARPSRFLAELPTELVERVQAKAAPAPPEQGRAWIQAMLAAAAGAEEK